MPFDRPIPHRCGLPTLDELRRKHAGQGTVWNCVCGDRWRLVINVGRASWFNLGNEDKRWIGEM